MSHATHMLGLCQVLNRQNPEFTQEEREHLRMVMAYCRRFLDGEEVVPGDVYNEMYELEYRSRREVA